MPISFKQLRYFAALAEAGSFGAAADEMNVTQPALSLQIKALERDLGARLVDRLPRGVRLTNSGRDVLERAQRILGDVIDLEHAVRHRDGLAGQLQLGVIPTVAPYLLPSVLTRLRAIDLTLDIRVREAQTAVLLQALSGGRLDAIVVALPVIEQGLNVVPLFEDGFLLCGSKAALSMLQDGALSAPDIETDRLLLLDEGHCLADQALDVCGLAGRAKVDLGASSLATLSGLVSQGFGLTLLPAIAAKAEQRAQPNLALRRFAAPEPSRTLALVTRSGAAGSDWSVALANLLRDAGLSVLDAPDPATLLDNAAAAV